MTNGLGITLVNHRIQVWLVGMPKVFHGEIKLKKEAFVPKDGLGMDKLGTNGQKVDMKVHHGSATVHSWIVALDGPRSGAWNE